MSALKLTDQLLHVLAGPEIPCTRKKDGKACTMQHDGKLDRKGCTVFYFSTGCKVVETFCPSCLAYWHVAVARNCLLEYQRDCAMQVAEDARMEREGK